MASRSIKIEKKFSVQEAAAFLRKLADNFEKSNTDPLQEFDVNFDVFKKFKIDIKRQNDIIELKAKVKYDIPDVSGEEVSSLGHDPGKMKYTSLKKLMDKNFKEIGKKLETGNLPDSALVQGFLEESKLMISYSGYGDEFYEKYISACEEFNSRFDSGVFDKISEQYAVLNSIKKECHSRYK